MNHTCNFNCTSRGKSPEVNNDNYEKKKEANNLQGRFNTYYGEKNTIFTFDQMQTGDNVSDKNTEEQIAKKNLQQYYTAVLKVILF